MIKSIQAKLLFLFLMVIFTRLTAQESTTTSVARLKADVEYLASEKLGGREAGTKYELLARDYIEKAFKDAGLSPYLSDSTYGQPFHYKYGLKFETKKITLGKKIYDIDFVFVPEVKEFTQTLRSKYRIYSNTSDTGLIPGQTLVVGAAGLGNKPLLAELRRIGKEAEKSGYKVLIYANPDKYAEKLDLSSYGKMIANEMIFIQLYGESAKKILNQKHKCSFIELKYAPEVQTAWNVVGYINNASPTTIVLGAHYDHLGLGAVNSRNNTRPAIHYGADDNASGTATVMELARQLNKQNPGKHNYLFIAFSAEEKGIIGSTYFVDNLNPDSKIVCMLNYDMVGRVDSSMLINLNATASSPAWDTLLSNAAVNTTLKLKKNSGGISGSDHLPFYLNNIPVVFFFTGIHTDYHTPGDTPDKINFSGMNEVLKYSLRLIERLSYVDSLPFSKVNMQEQSRTPSKQTVTLGVIPDHSWDGQGMRLSGVLEGKTAERFGFLKNDIIISIGEYKVNSIEDYMKAMGKFKTGETAVFSVIRQSAEMAITVTF